MFQLQQYLNLQRHIFQWHKTWIRYINIQKQRQIQRLIQ